MAADGIGQRALVFADDEVGRVWRRHFAFMPGDAQEGGIGKEKASVAVDHGKAERQPRQQRLYLRQAGAGIADAGMAVDDEEQRRDERRVDRVARIGIGDRDMEKAHRHAAPAFLGEIDVLLRIGFEMADEIAAGDVVGFGSGRARDKGAVSGEHTPIGGDDGGLDAFAAQRATGLSGHGGHGLGQRIMAHDRGQPPDQMILTPPGAMDRQGERAAGGGDFADMGLAITPCGPGGLFGARGVGGAKRQARRRGGAEPLRKARVGADQPPGAVGDRDRLGRVFDRGVRHRPVGRGKFGRGHGRAQRQRGAQDQPEHHHAARICRGDQCVAGKHVDRADAERERQADQRNVAP